MVSIKGMWGVNMARRRDEIRRASLELFHDTRDLSEAEFTENPKGFDQFLLAVHIWPLTEDDSVRL